MKYLIGFNGAGQAEAGTTQVSLETLPGFNTIILGESELKALCGEDWQDKTHYLRLVDGKVIYDPEQEDDDETD